MDLTKLISLLEKSALYFPRVDTLARADPFEGYYTKVNAAFASLTYATAPEELKKALNLKDEGTFEALFGHLRRTGEIAKRMRALTYVNSWHVLEHESAAMWSLYLRSQDGIAIQSTYASLTDSLAACDEFPIHVGLIRYIDYNTEGIPGGQVLFPMMHKRKSFEHECELRALIWIPEVEGKKRPGADVFNSPEQNPYREMQGFYVKTDMDMLIHQIFVAPSAPSWIVEIVAALAARYGVKKPVIHSQLAEPPLF